MRGVLWPVDLPVTAAAWAPRLTPTLPRRPPAPSSPRYVREAKAQHPRITTMHDRSHGAGLHHMSRHSSMQGSLPAKAAEQALAAVQGSSSGAGARPAAGQGSPPREPRRAPHGGADGGSGGGGGGAQAVPATRLRRTSS